MYNKPVHNLKPMSINTTYTSARANFATLCNEVTSTRDVVIIRRRGAEDVALISAAEMRSLQETAHLLRSPRNAQRLIAALLRARKGKGRPQKAESLRIELGLDSKE